VATFETNPNYTANFRRDGFTTNDKLAISEEAGDLPIKLGYEKDKAWV